MIKTSNKNITTPKISEKAIIQTKNISIGFIKDSSIDWVESITSSQFVVDNPLAKSSCGCGSSFSI